MKDVNGNELSIGDKVLEVGAPVEEPGTIDAFSITGEVRVAWPDAHATNDDGCWYDYSTDLMKVFGQEPDGSYIVVP